MTTARERNGALQITRIIIFIMGICAIFLDNTLGDISAAVSLFLWLWMPRLVQVELRILAYVKSIRGAK
jgi:hypothetical protein